MNFNRFALSLGLVFVCWMQTVNAGLISFRTTHHFNDLSGNFAPVETLVTVTQEDARSLRFTLDVDDSITGNLADIRGLFFDVSDESLLSGLSVVGVDALQDTQFNANSVDTIDEGFISSQFGPFDAGIEIGVEFDGFDTEASFVLTHDSQNISYESFFRTSLASDDYVLGVYTEMVAPTDGADVFGDQELEIEERPVSFSVAAEPERLVLPDVGAGSDLVPEPVSGVCWIGLLGMGLLGRRRQQRKMA